MTENLHFSLEVFNYVGLISLCMCYDAYRYHLKGMSSMATSKKGSAKKAASKKPAKKKAAAKKPAAAKKKAAKRTPNAAFMKPMQPSEALGAVVGSKPIPRTEITKKIWDYIK